MFEVVTVTIKKPLYGNYVYIRSEILDSAIRKDALLEIVVPAGSALVDPAKWKEEGKRMEKVFKIPTKPMVLYGGYVPIRVEEKGKIVPKKEKGEEEIIQNKLF